MPKKRFQPEEIIGRLRHISGSHGSICETHEVASKPLLAPHGGVCYTSC
jgi:hypothetical protein